MKIAVLSGKGGTGKTTLSVNLFSRLNQATLIDTDVEEPNSHIFLQYDELSNIPITKQYPVVDDTLCTLCAACGDICQFNVIFPTKKNVLVIADLCHDCGGCKLVCPTNAITYQPKSIGHITHCLSTDSKHFYYGDLNVGEVSGVKIIEQLKEITKDEDLVIIDSPPGTSCSTVTSIEGVDYAIVVSEPTPFGVSDMKMVVEMLNAMQIPFGVVINKAGLGNNEIYEYLTQDDIQLIEEIRYDRDFAMYYSRGTIISNESEYYKEKIDNIIHTVFGEQYVR